MANGLVFTVNTITPRLAALPAKLRAATIAVTQREAPKSEAHMRRTAPWHDRTGNARASLNAHAEHSATQDSVVLAHGVSYGFWLEVIEGGEWSVIIPSLPVRGQAMMQTCNKLFARM